ncbi:uncharacterized protein [Macaca nemestrina]|uniref:uncharacterized protein n=1 Tax=Macaca nemestrina TaxID=9545 RepID=UPI0039B845CF
MLFFHCLELQGRRGAGKGARGAGVINTGEAPLRLPLPPTPPSLHPLRFAGKSLDAKGWGRTKSLWKTSLLSHCLCDWGSCGGEDAVVPSSGAPHPHPSPRCQCARTRAAFYFFFLVFLFHILPTPLPFFHLSFLPSFLPSFLLSFLRRKASLSVFTADLDLNVHTIKARGECQEWGWLSTVGRQGPAKEGATDRTRRPPQTSAQRLRARGEGFRAPSGCLSRTGARGVGRCAACDRQGLRDANRLRERNRSWFCDRSRSVQHRCGVRGEGVAWERIAECLCVQIFLWAQDSLYGGRHFPP